MCGSSSKRERDGSSRQDMASQEGISQDQTVSTDVEERLQTRTIAETLHSLNGCSELADLLQENGPTAVLAGSGLHTLFAPMDEAFQTRPADPEAFLSAHLSRGSLLAADLRQAGQVQMESGKSIAVDAGDGRLHVGSAVIVRSDIAYTTGISM